MADKLVEADINEPMFDHRVPGAVVYAHPGERLRIQVLNCDTVPHSLHLHGLDYGIDSDGAWPFGLKTTDGRRSDEICPNQSWTYEFDVRDDMVGAWPFHDHAQQPAVHINRGLFGAIIVLPRKVNRPPRIELPDLFLDARKIVVERCDTGNVLDKRHRVFVADAVEFLKEWLGRRFTLPFPKRPVLHVPVFFHYMTSPQTSSMSEASSVSMVKGAPYGIVAGADVIVGLDVNAYHGKNRS